MRVILAGSRPPLDIRSHPVALAAWYEDNMPILEAAIADSGFTITEVVCGKAAGFDTLGERWARRRGIPVKPFHAYWKLFGKAAGAIRNKDMGDYADCAVVCCFAGSKGSEHMAGYMESLGKPVHRHELR